MLNAKECLCILLVTIKDKIDIENMEEYSSVRVAFYSILQHITAC